MGNRGAAVGGEDRLVVQLKFVEQQCRSEVPLDKAPVALVRQQVVFESNRQRSSTFLALVERKVGLRDQIVDLGRVCRPERQTDGRREACRPTLDRDRLSKDLKHVVAQSGETRPIVLTDQGNAEFVAAKTADQRLRQEASQHLDQMHQRGIASAVTMGIVEHLQIVHVDLHIGDRVGLVRQQVP